MNAALITSGGDSPGMNACLANLTKELCGKNHEVYGYKGGFCGIRDEDYRRLAPRDVQDWYKLGGTMLKAGRMPELREEKWRELLVKNLRKNQIDVLIVIGGDGSFKGALSLHETDPALTIVGIPGTIDNNIYGSDYTIGFDTALNTQTAYIDRISDTASSIPGRVFFVETLGAWDGYLTNSSVLMGMADFAVLVEAPLANEEICARVKACLEKKEKDYVLVTFAEGAEQMFSAAEYVRKQLGVNLKCNLLGFAQRGGSPTAMDRLHAAGFAKHAVKAVESGRKQGYIVYKNGKYDCLDIALAARKKTFDWFEL